MATSADNMTLAELLQANEVEPAVLTYLAREPWKITTIKQLANTFETKKDIKTEFVVQVPELASKGDQVANLTQAWREAESRIARSIKRAADNLPEEGLEDPLRAQVDDALKATFSDIYKFVIPSSWMGVPSLIGRLHRELNKRALAAHKVDAVRTLSAMSSLGQAIKKQKLAENIEISIGEVSTGRQQINGPWQYLLALQCLMYSLAYAGCFKMNEALDTFGTKEVIMVPLQLTLNHLANAQAFVLWRV